MCRHLRCRRLTKALAAGLSRGVTLWFGCLLILHAPDGSELKISTDHVIALRPSSAVPTEHLARGTQTVLYMAGKTFGVTESIDEISERIKRCRMQEE